MGEFQQNQHASQLNTQREEALQHLSDLQKNAQRERDELVARSQAEV